MKKNMTIALLATGDELTQGSILNTNAQAMAQALFSYGLEPHRQMVVSDDIHDIQTALSFLLQRHAVVITIGGLGPTSDDKTRFALAASLGETLVLHEPSWNKIKARYQQLNLPITELAQQQALFPKKAKILENAHGSANGCSYVTNGQWGEQRGEQWIFMLPGPPRECLPMFTTDVLPLLKQQYAAGNILLQWKVFGVAEGMIAEKVDTVLKPYAPICRTSFRWDYPYVDCKVLLDEHAPERAEIIALLNPLLSPYQLDLQNQTATERLKKFLIDTNRPVLIQDEATGGVLESRIHVPANHHRLSFANVHKFQEPLFFHIKGLDNYWTGAGGLESELILISQEGTKKFTVPFRSVLLEIYVAEFIAHQIFLQLSAKNAS